uniref:ORF53g n=1 Tax=Pinus koraiensis TaxID=88728 RepID=Q85WZ4_PINKO|nr:ORF53g [Pinus koraiensis]AAO74075.1 ORF53g [Pinus koraiensis]
MTTAALSSDRIIIPLSRSNSLQVRITTALTTSDFSRGMLGTASLIIAIITSPI